MLPTLCQTKRAATEKRPFGLGVRSLGKSEPKQRCTGPEDLPRVCLRYDHVKWTFRLLPEVTRLLINEFDHAPAIDDRTYTKCSGPDSLRPTILFKDGPFVRQLRKCLSTGRS